jgi:O-antigen/teichoic acid export membrane protein
MVLRGMALMTGLNVAKAAASLVISITIAVVVPPEQFGLVAFAIPLMALIMLVTDLGLSSAIVRHPQLDRRQAGSAIGMMGIAGLVGGALMALGATPIESAMSMQGVGRALQGFAVVTACAIWATAPRALLERTLSYPQIVAVESLALAAALAAFGVGIMASAGITALVAFHVVLQAIRALTFTALARRLFRIGLSVASISSLVQVGSWVFITNLLSYCARNLDRMLIGGVLGAASLGLYGLAYQFMTIPLVLISWPVSGVLLSTLSRMDKTGPDRPAVICAVVTATASITLPMMTFLVFGARHPIEVLYTSRWEGLADIITILAPVGAVQAIAAYNGAVLVEKGAVRLNFYLGLLNGLTLSSVFLATVWFGLTTVIVSYALAAIAVSATMIYFMCREAGIEARMLAACFLPGGAAALLGVFAVALTTGFRFDSTGRWALGATAYVAAVLVILFIQRGRLLASAHALAGARVTLAAPH